MRKEREKNEHKQRPESAEAAEENDWRGDEWSDDEGVRKVSEVEAERSNEVMRPLTS